MADGGNSFLMAAALVSNAKPHRKTEVYTVDTACITCQEPFNCQVPEMRPYRICHQEHFLCGRCIKAMIENKNGGVGATNDMGSQRTVIEFDEKRIFVKELLSHYHDPYEPYNHVKVTLQCPYKCPHPPEVRAGSGFYRSKDREAHIMNGLDPDGITCAEVSALQRTSDACDQAYGGLTHVMKLLKNEMDQLTHVHGQFGKSIPEKQAELKKIIEEKAELEKKIEELETEGSALVETNIGLMADLKRKARKEVIDEHWKEKDELESELKSLQSEFDKKFEELNDIHTRRVNELDKIYDDRETELKANHEQKKAKLKSQMEKAERKHAERCKKYDEMYEILSKNESEAFEASRKRNEEMIREFELLCNEKKMRLERDYDTRCEKHNADIIALEFELSSAKQNFEDHIHQMDSEIEDHRKKVDEAVSSITRDYRLYCNRNDKRMAKIEQERKLCEENHKKFIEMELEKIDVESVINRLRNPNDRAKVIQILSENYKRDLAKRNRIAEEEAKAQIDDYIRKVKLSKKAHCEAKHREMLADIEKERVKMMAEIERERVESKRKIASRLSEINACIPTFTVWFNTNKKNAA